MQKFYYLNTMKKGAKFIGLFLFCFQFSFFIENTFAIGLSPVVREMENLLKNTEYDDVVYISRGNPSHDAYANVEIGGPVASYIFLHEGNRIFLPKGETTIPVPFTVRSGNLGSGTYEATVIVTLQDSGQNGRGNEVGSTIIGGVEGKIRFSVTNDAQEKFSITHVHIFETEEGQPIGFLYRLENSGNVDARPTRIQVVIADQKTNERIYEETVDDKQLPFVKAFKTEDINVGLQTTLKAGQYNLQVDFYNKNAVIYNGGGRFIVHPPGTLHQKGELQSLTLEKNNFQEGEPIKLFVVFKNTGTVALFGSLALEVFYKDQRIDFIKGDPVFIAANQPFTFEYFYKPLKKGEYTVKAFVLFGSRKSNEKQASFRVGEAQPLIFWGVLTGLAAVIAMLVVLFYRRTLKKVSKPKIDPPKPTSHSPPSQKTRKKKVT